MSDWIKIIGGVAVTIAIIWGTYWIAKTVSYTIFYEDMVKQTITEMVKANSLK